MKTAFETNYKAYGPLPVEPELYYQIQKQNEYSYGEVLNFKTFTYCDSDAAAIRA